MKASRGEKHTTAGPKMAAPPPPEHSTDCTRINKSHTSWISKRTPPRRRCYPGHNTVFRSGKPEPGFSPGDHQSIVGAGAPRRHLQRGNGVKGHRCRRQRQSRCRVRTRSLSTTLQLKAVDPHQQPPQPTTPHGDHKRLTTNRSAGSSGAAGRSASHRTMLSTMLTRAGEHCPKPRTTMVPGCSRAAHADELHARLRAAAEWRIRPPRVEEEGAAGPSGPRSGPERT